MSRDVKRALWGEENQLRNILNLILAYEKGHWSEFSIFAHKLDLSETEVPAVYVQALLWADEFIVRI